ncbi:MULTISPECIES: hypothetical protein [Roseivirga]|jgi:hypothetical protein|uniref:Uncharacterized protein n=1 Tax=Roseivirga thermotolerans TaxID=1758176 RepID=A0ABQ3IBC6_9BACT|nr:MULTISPECIES: hypothetical protein [Roseivirga]MEC7755620.1 hypothetical protein [Bacteroidota bacterium]GHE71302.1 hypothetical protein GCM10011340_29040 [Roseivirga thermotolerans]|tara:strand:- start:1273 stop:1491 length:219 start_codon:yes stop_codon:yes gene_type:complete
MFITIEVFKTNVSSQAQAALIKTSILHHFPHLDVNFDLEDRDNILRVEGEVDPGDIMLLVRQSGVEINLLLD